MNLRTVVLALAAGVATTLLVGVSVTEPLLPAIEFSVLVGLPVGIAAGLLAGALVLLGLAGRETRPANRHAAAAVGMAGLGLLVVFALVVALVNVGATLALIGSAVAGLLLGIGTFVWLERRTETSVHAVTSR